MKTPRWETRLHNLQPNKPLIQYYHGNSSFLGSQMSWDHIEDDKFSASGVTKNDEQLKAVACNGQTLSSSEGEGKK